MIQSRDSRSTARTIRLTDDGGAVHEVCHVSGSIRDGRSVAIVVDVFEPSSLSGHEQAVMDEVMHFVSAVFADAAATGLPVCPMNGDV